MIYTGYFARLNSYKANKLVPVAVSGYVPSFYKGARYKSLAPKKETFQRWKNGEIDNFEYTRLYKEQVLDQLDVKRTVRALQMIGDDVILLCYEKSGDFCHRHIIADWLEEAGIKVDEYQG